MNKVGKYVCDSCGKGVQHSNLVSFSKNRVHHVRRPNLHSAKVLVNGLIETQRLCTKCLRKAVRPHKLKLAAAAAATAAK